MATSIEAGFLRLHSLLGVAARESLDLPATVQRNASLRDLFGQVVGGDQAYLNLIDDDGDILDTIIGPDGQYWDEIAQKAVIEFIVLAVSPQTRDRTFSNGMEAIAKMVRAARREEQWDSLDVLAIERANLSTGPLPGIKAARITLEMLMTAPDLFGVLSSDRVTGQLDDVTGVAFGTLTGGDVGASSIILLQDVIGTGTAALLIAGQSAGQLEDVLGTASGALLIAGTSAGLLDDVIGSANAALLISGQATGLLEDVAGSASAELMIEGQSTGQLEDVTGTAQGALDLGGQGTSTVTLDDVTGSAVAELEIAGEATGQLDDVTGTASGELLIAGTASGQLEDVTGTASGDLQIVGQSAGQLEDVTGTSTGALQLAGSSAGQLEDVTGSATAALQIEGTATGQLDDVTGSASGALQIEGQAAGQLEDVTGTATGSLSVAGNEPETDALLARMSVQPSTAIETSINNFIAGLKLNGLWSKFDHLNIMSLHDEQAGQRNYIKDAHNISIVGTFPGSFVPSKGYQSAAGGAVDTDCLSNNFSDAASPRQMGAGNMAWGLFMLVNNTFETQANYYSTFNGMQNRHTSGEIRMRGISLNEQAVDPAAENNSFYVLTDDGTTERVFKNGVQQGAGITSGGGDFSGNLYLFGSTNAANDTGIMAATFSASYMTPAEVATFESLLRTHLTELGAFA